ncbi:MAG: hypothetical protein AAB483_03170 [Patescibacteria group bacterium]
MADEQYKCGKCGGETDGWRCVVCPDDRSYRPDDHDHYGYYRYHVPKCKECDRTAGNCTCA